MYLEKLTRKKDSLIQSIRMSESQPKIFNEVSNSRIGEIIENGNKKIIRDAFGHKLGEFDGKVTRDDHGRLVGTGDLLTSLLK